MNRVNPKFVLRNHLAEQAIRARAAKATSARCSALAEGAASARSTNSPSTRPTPASRPTGRNASRCPVHHERTLTDKTRYPVKKTDAEWRAAARPDAIPGDAPRRHRARLHRQVLGPLGRRQLPLRRLRHAAVRVRAPSSTPAAAGRASGSRSTARSHRARASTAATAWCASRCAAPTAARTSATCSRRPRADRRALTASTRRRSTSSPRPDRTPAPMKLLLDFLPIILFFGAFKYAEANKDWAAAFATEHLGFIVSGGVVGAEEAPVLLATVVVIVATLAQVAWLLARGQQGRPDAVGQPGAGGRARRRSPIWFHNETFIKWKPSVLYWAMGLAFWLSQLRVRARTCCRRCWASSSSCRTRSGSGSTSRGSRSSRCMGAAQPLGRLQLLAPTTWVNFKLFGGIGLMLALHAGAGPVPEPLPEGRRADGAAASRDERADADVTAQRGRAALRERARSRRSSR